MGVGRAFRRRGRAAYRPVESAREHPHARQVPHDITSMAAQFYTSMYVHTYCREGG